MGGAERGLLVCAAVYSPRRRPLSGETGSNSCLALKLISLGIIDKIEQEFFNVTKII